MCIKLIFIQIPVRNIISLLLDHLPKKKKKKWRNKLLIFYTDSLSIFHYNDMGVKQLNFVYFLVCSNLYNIIQILTTLSTIGMCSCEIQAQLALHLMHNNIVN